MNERLFQNIEHSNLLSNLFEDKGPSQVASLEAKNAREKQMSKRQCCCLESKWLLACVWSEMENRNDIDTFSNIDWHVGAAAAGCGQGGKCKVAMRLRHIVSIVSDVRYPYTQLDLQEALLRNHRHNQGDASAIIRRTFTVTTHRIALEDERREVDVVTHDYGESLETTASRASRLTASYQQHLVTVRVCGAGDSFPTPGTLQKTIDEGVSILEGHYVFLYASNSQVGDRTAIFINPAASKKTPRDLRVNWLQMDQLEREGPFKVLQRVGLLASSEKFFLKLDPTDWEEGVLPDFNAADGQLLTDGAGLIDRDFALQHRIIETPEHCAVQFRFQGRKGVLLAVPGLQGKSIQFRPSQRKFVVGIKHDAVVQDELSVLRANEYHPSTANREMIQLLDVLEASEGTVKRRLEDLHHEHIRNNFKVVESPEYFVRELLNSSTIGQDYPLREILNKFGRLMTSDPWWHSCLRKLYSYLIEKSRWKFSFPIPNGARLLGAPDPFATLNDGEVFVSVHNNGGGGGGMLKVIDRDVIVFRNPCLHPGDVRRLRAVSNPALEAAGYTNIILFPAREHGCETSIPHSCSGGDLDGDDFTVIWDSDLVNIDQREPMNYANLDVYKQPASRNPTLGEAFEAASNGMVGQLSNLHAVVCALETEGAESEISTELAKAVSVAVDFPKDGRFPRIPKAASKLKKDEGFPQFIKNKSDRHFRATNFLGKLFDFGAAFSFDDGTSTLVETAGSIIDITRVANINDDDAENSVIKELVKGFYARQKSIVFMSGVETEQEFYLGISLTKFLERSDHHRLKSLRTLLVKEFMEAFHNSIPPGVPVPEWATKWFLAASNGGVGALAWLLQEHIDPVSSFSSSTAAKLGSMIEEYATNERKRDQRFRDAQNVASDYAYDDLSWTGAQPVMSEIALFRWTGRVPIVIKSKEVFAILSEQENLTEVGGELVGPVEVYTNNQPHVFTVLIRQQEREVNCPALPPDQIEAIYRDVLTLILAANETVNGGCSKESSAVLVRKTRTAITKELETIEICASHDVNITHRLHLAMGLVAIGTVGRLVQLQELSAAHCGLIRLQGSLLLAQNLDQLQIRGFYKFVSARRPLPIVASAFGASAKYKLIQCHYSPFECPLKKGHCVVQHVPTAQDNAFGLSSGPKNGFIRGFTAICDGISSKGQYKYLRFDLGRMYISTGICQAVQHLQHDEHHLNFAARCEKFHKPGHYKDHIELEDFKVHTGYRRFFNNPRQLLQQPPSETYSPQLNMTVPRKVEFGTKLRSEDDAFESDLLAISLVTSGFTKKRESSKIEICFTTTTGKMFFVDGNEVLQRIVEPDLSVETTLMILGGVHRDMQVSPLDIKASVTSHVVQNDPGALDSKSWTDFEKFHFTFSEMPHHQIRGMTVIGNEYVMRATIQSRQEVFTKTINVGRLPLEIRVTVTDYSEFTCTETNEWRPLPNHFEVAFEVPIPEDAQLDRAQCENIFDTALTIVNTLRLPPK